MDQTAQVIAAACSLAVLLPALHLVVAAYLWPSTVVAANMPYHDAPRSRRWLGYAYLGLSWLGIALVTGFGTAALLGWIPSSWGSVDEDGNFDLLQRSIGAFAGLAIGTMVFCAMLRRAETTPEGQQRTRQAELRDAEIR